MLESIKVTGNVTLCNNCRDCRLHRVTIVLVTYNDVSSDANFSTTLFCRYISVLTTFSGETISAILM